MKIRKMKNKFLLITLIAVGTINAFAWQPNPVHWKFYATKMSEKTYAVHLRAVVKFPWHIYSENTPKGGAIPTKIVFQGNPNVMLVGKIKEVGKLIRVYQKFFGSEGIYFRDTANFVQLIKLRSNTKTVLGGAITYMTCSTMYRPPETVRFSVELK